MASEALRSLNRQLRNARRREDTAERRYLRHGNPNYKAGCPYYERYTECTKHTDEIEQMRDEESKRARREKY